MLRKGIKAQKGGENTYESTDSRQCKETQAKSQRGESRRSAERYVSLILVSLILVGYCSMPRYLFGLIKELFST